MASQLQYNHAESCGMWSWMDGDIRQTVTRHDGKAEEVVVTPSCFQLPHKGWTHPTATGRDHGAPYIDSWRVAFEARPAFIQIHQWNEFAGQKEGEGMVDDYWAQTGKPPSHKTQIYGDEYNLDLSDDIEPTRMTGCAYRGCGGWGYYYVNLTKALISLYRGETPDATVMALSGPFQPASIKGRNVQLHWSVLGKTPASYSIAIDQRPVAQGLHGSEYNLDCSKLSPGQAPNHASGRRRESLLRSRSIQIDDQVRAALAGVFFDRIHVRRPVRRQVILLANRDERLLRAGVIDASGASSCSTPAGNMKNGLISRCQSSLT